MRRDFQIWFQIRYGLITDALAGPPPTGWNSWNMFGSRIGALGATSTAGD